MRILVIEDEAKIANFIQSGLREEGYFVDKAGDGATGLDLASGGAYDVVVLDRMLPEMEGAEVCRRIRKKGLTTPIIMLTAKDTVEDRVAGLDAGADDYLIKPFAFEEFLARIRARLRTSNGISINQLTVGDLVLDLRTRRATRSGRVIELSSKEFGLLEYLMYNAGTAVSRALISQHVWDINFDTYTNVIDVHITRLRKKIDADFEAKLIHTVRGCGYMIKAADPEPAE